jgi:regulator of cell morphogenesis and NO signaling
MERETEVPLRERGVGELVADDYGLAAVFSRFGIDFCCGGGRSVGEASARAGVPYETLERALLAVGRDTEGPSADDVRTWDLHRLTDHIERVHHEYVRERLPVLRQWTTKVARVHGGRHTELVEVRDAVDALGSELEPHMRAEEEILFPRIAILAADPTAAPVEATGEAIEAMEDDHERAGALMKRLRELTSDFRPPADACATYRAAFALLEEFEADLHRHVHLENNILFPRATALEAERAARASA